MITLLKWFESNFYFLAGHFVVFYFDHESSVHSTAMYSYDDRFKWIGNTLDGMTFETREQVQSGRSGVTLARDAAQLLSAKMSHVRWSQSMSVRI